MTKGCNFMFILIKVIFLGSPVVAQKDPWCRSAPGTPAPGLGAGGCPAVLVLGLPPGGSGASRWGLSEQFSVDGFSFSLCSDSPCPG